MSTQSAATPPSIRLVIADVDGTLVTKEKVLTPRAIAAVARLRAANVRFAVTSERPPKGMSMINDALQLTEPLAAFNGGVVVNPDLSVVASHLLSADIAAAVIRMIHAHGLDA